MTLRTKLLLIALSVLVLPWAGWQLLRQMEALLRQGQEQALLASAEALARAIAASPEVVPARGPTLFVQRLPVPPQADGEFADWPGIELRRFGGGHGGAALALALARADGALWLRIEVTDPTPRPADAHWSTAGRSDRLRLTLDGALGIVSLRLANAQSGPLRVTAADGGAPSLRLDGYWRQRADGYAVELQLPFGLDPERLGLQAIDVDADGLGQSFGTGNALADALWPLAERNPRLAQPIRPLLPDDMRVRLVDADGWILTELGELPDAGPAATMPWWRRVLYQWFVFGNDPWAEADRDAARSANEAIWQALSGLPATHWQRDRSAPRLLLAAAVPVRAGGDVRGALLLEREHQTLLLTERALTGLVGGTLLALLIAGSIVFLFASRLSWRIGRLRDATEQALERDGRLRAFPTSTARDEIGDLSRSFARLLGEIAASQDYLRSLAGKLSHELNTPIAIVRGALDNVDAAALADGDRACVERARAGADRLAAIVRTMGEASRIEQALAHAEVEQVDLAALLATLVDGYRGVLAPRRVELQLPVASVPLLCAPELLVQALDKLIDNARAFTAESGWVRITLRPLADAVEVAVANQGPPLPAALRPRLFDSMVSVRGERRGGGVNLGFGLYLVRLVTEWHRGGARAEDLPDGDGVEVTMLLRGLPRR